MERKRTLNSVDAVTLKDSVYRELFRAIVSGRLAPGERLVLEPLAEQLGVSIMPVREAIRKLEALRIVTVRNRRISVNALSTQNVKDTLKVRLLLEGYAAAEAAKIGHEDLKHRLEELLAEMDQTDHLDLYMKANRAFHSSIYKECKNSILIEVIESVWERYSPYLYISLEGQSIWKNEGVREPHLRIIEAYHKRDSEGIRHWVVTDLNNAAQRVLEVIHKTEG